jgi:hypothetical protein
VACKIENSNNRETGTFSKSLTKYLKKYTWIALYQEATEDSITQY